MLHYYLPIIGARYTRFIQEIRFSNTYIRIDCFTNQITDSIWGSNEWVDTYQIVIDQTFCRKPTEWNNSDVLCPETTKLIFMKDVKGIYDEEKFYFSGC